MKKNILLLLVLCLPISLFAQDEWMVSYSFSFNSICKGLFFEDNSLQSKLRNSQNGIPIYFMDEKKNAVKHPSALSVRLQRLEGKSHEEVKAFFKKLSYTWNKEKMAEKPDSYFEPSNHLLSPSDDYFTIHFVFKGKKNKLVPYPYLELNSMDVLEENEKMLLQRKHLGAFALADVEQLAKKSIYWAYQDNNNYKVNWAEAFKSRYFQPFTIEVRKNRELVAVFEDGEKSEKATNWKGELPDFVQQEVFWESKQPTDKQLKKARAERFYETSASIYLEDSSRVDLYQESNLFVALLLESAQKGEIQAYEFSKEWEIIPIEKGEVMGEIRKPVRKDYNAILFNQIANWVENEKPSTVFPEEYQPEGHYAFKEFSELEFTQELSVNNAGEVSMKPETQWIKVVRYGGYVPSGISKTYYHFKASDIYQLLKEKREARMLAGLKGNFKNGLLGWSLFDLLYSRSFEVYSKPFTAKSSNEYDEIKSETFKKDMDAISNWLLK